MGLDISVSCTVKQAREALKWDDCGVKLREVALKIIESAPEDDSIHSRPGSYHGLHVVRAAFCEMKRLPPEPTVTSEDKGVPEAHLKYHLLNHSDCDGWYLPDEFDEPVWAGSTSIGSSIALLSELEELFERAEKADWRWRWDAIYIAAAASVACGDPVKFS